MKYPIIIGLLFITMTAVQCGPGPALPADIEETSTPHSAPTLPPASPALSPEPEETPPPPATPTPTPAATGIKTGSPIPPSSQRSGGGTPQLRMVLIRTTSSNVKQLRQMAGLDVIRVRTVDAGQTPVSKEDLLNREVIVEAVATTGILTKLKSMGFEISEAP